MTGSRSKASASHRSFKRSHRWLMLAASVGSAGLTRQALADNGTWSGAFDSTWSNAANWSLNGGAITTGLLPPGVTTAGALNPDIATFNSATGATIGIDLGRQIGGIVFNNGSTGTVGSFTIGSNGGNPLTLLVDTTQNHSITMSAGATSSETIAAPLVFQTNIGTLTNGSFATYNYLLVNNSTTPAAVLNVTGPVSYYGSNTSSYTTAGPVGMDLFLNGTNTGVNTISGNITNVETSTATQISNPLQKNGAGTWALSGNNTFDGVDVVGTDLTAGGTTASTWGNQLNAGTLIVESSTALGNAATTSDYVPGTYVFWNVHNAAAILEVANNPNGNTPITLPNGVEITMVATSTLLDNGNQTINSVINLTPANGHGVNFNTSSATDVLTLGNVPNDLSGGNATSVININGPGTVFQTQPSNYAGRWALNSGTLKLGDNAALGSSPSVAFGNGSTGTLTLNGTSPTLINLSTTAANVGTPIVQNGSATTPSTLTLNPPAAMTYAGTIQDGNGSKPLSLALQGSPITFSGASTYSGGTTVNQSTLIVSNGTVGSATGTGPVLLNGGGVLTGIGSVAGSVVQSGGTFIPGNGSSGITTAGGFNYSGGAIQFTLNGANIGGINVSNATFTATPQLLLTPIGASGGITPTLLQSANPIGGASFLSPSNLQQYNVKFGRLTLTPFYNSSSNAIVVISSGIGPQNLIWAGGISPTHSPAGDGTTWSDNQASGGQNFNNGGSADYFYDNDLVTFNDAGSPSHTVNLTTANSLSSGAGAIGMVTVSTASSYTFQGGGSLAGTGSLNIASGTLFLNTASNTYIGGTLINTGAKLVTIASNVLPSAGVVNVSGGAFDIGGTSQAIGGLTGTNASTSVVVSNNGSSVGALTFAGVGTSTFPGVIEDTNNATTGASLSITEASVGVGTQVLTGANNYSGGTNLNSGTLQISAANNLGANVAANTINFNGGTLQSSGGTYSLGNNQSFELNGPGTLQVSAGTLTVPQAIYTNNASLTVQGAGNAILSGVIGIAGSGGVTVLGPGVVTITNSQNNYTGQTNVSGGTLVVGSTGAINSNGVVYVNDGATFTMLPGSVVNLDPVGADNPIQTGTLDAVNGSNARLNIYGGTLTYATAQSNEQDLKGIWTQTGGTVNTTESGFASDFGTTASASANLIYYLGGTGTYTSGQGQYGSFALGVRSNASFYLSQNGSLTVTGDSSPNSEDVFQLFVGSLYGGTVAGATHLFVQQGGTVNTNGLVIGSRGAILTGSTNPANAQGNGAYYLNGGTLTTGELNGGTNQNGSTGTLIFGGGKLIAAQAFSTNSLLITQINAGGATIDLAGNSLLWGAGISAGTNGNLVAPTISTPLGSGYVTAPAVTISGGGGSGASAVAEINQLGQVVDIVVTNPGTNYNSGASAITFKLGNAPTGGTNAGNVSGSSLNTAGGLSLLDSVHNSPLTFEINGLSNYAGPTVYPSNVTLQLGDGTAGDDGSITSSSSITNNGALVYNTFGSVSSASSISGAGPFSKLGAGTLTLSGSDSYTGATNVSAGSLILAGAHSLPTGAKLTISPGASVVATALTSETTLVVSSLTMTGAVLDLNNNGLVVHSSTVAAVAPLVTAGYSGGRWNGSNGAIISTSASTDTTHLHALGVIQNSANGSPSGTALYTSFNNNTATGLVNTDVLVKYTYYGDANLSGAVDGSDYSRIDNSFLTESAEATPFSVGVTGWYNGDFNYDGVVNGSDYTLIDNAYNSQGAAIAAQLAGPTAAVTDQIAGASGSSAIPEPASLALLGIGALGALGRRRRR